MFLMKPTLAKILVELHISKQYPHEVWLGLESKGYLQEVEIENLPPFCHHCKYYSHFIINYFILNPNLKNVANNVSEGNVNNIGHVMKDRPSLSKEYITFSISSKKVNFQWE